MTNPIAKAFSLQGEPTQRFALLFLLGLSCFIVFARFHTYDEPVEHDITTAAVIANEVREGRAYYSDLWEIKPPGWFAGHVVAQSLFGYGPGSLYALNVGLAVITLFGVYSAASSGGGSRVAGLWAAVFWTLTSGDLNLQANQSNTEAFMNPPLIWAFALLLLARKNEKGSYVLRTLLIAVLLALPTFCKPQSVFYAVFLCLAHVIYPPERTASGRKQALKDVLIIAGVGATAWIAFFTYYAMTGRFQIVYTTMFIYPSYYAGSVFRNVLKSLGSALYPRQLQFTAPLVFLTLVGAIVAWLKRSARPWMLLIAYALGTQLTIAIAGKFYSHYYQLWLPLFAVGAGWSIVLLGHIIKESYATWMPHAFAVIALVFMLQAEIWVYAMDPNEWSVQAYGGLYVPSGLLARELNNILQPGETLYVLGDEPGFYFITGRRPAPGVFFLTPLTGGPLAQELTTRVINDLQHKPPDLVIILANAIGDKTTGPDKAELGPDHPLRKWISQNYCQVVRDERTFFHLCARPGSELEKRPSYQKLLVDIAP
jgi:hypothetical protein